MKAESWKKIIDDLDDDIVDSAAERLSKPEHSTVDDMEAFTHEGKPTEYKYPSERKKHRGLYIGIGSAAAAVAGFVLLNNSGLVMSPNPVLTAESSSAETYATTPFVAYVEKSAPDTQSELVSIQTDGIDFDLFDEYFYDVWEMTDDESGEVVDIQLGYGDTTIFGEHGYTYDCLGTILTGEGCYMIAAGEGQYDLWFVPENDRNSLIVYCDAQIEDGQVVYEGSMIKCAATVIFSGYGTEKLEEDGSLGYFGQEKLAQKMGLTTEYLFEEPAMSESTSVYPEDGSTAKNWVRTYELRGTNIRLVSQSSDKVVVTELMEDSNSGAGEWFDITWTYSGGEWLTTGYAVSEIMPFSDTYEYLDKNKFQTFEDMFAGTWQENSTGAELTMDYTEDPFEPGDHIFIYYIYHGMALFCAGAQGNTAYYIPDDEPDVMYQYAATEKSGNVVKRSEYTNVYTRRDGEFTPIDEAAVSRLGFKKYLNTYSEHGDVMNNLILEKYDSIWSHAFYMPGVSSFGGYTVFQTGDGSYIFTYQEYNRDTGADRWVTYTITNTIKGWFTERAVADSGNFSIELEVPDGGQSDS